MSNTPRTSPSAPHPFVPAWWCRGPHLQTLWPVFARRQLRVARRRERLELPDGDFLDLDWTVGRDGPIVLVLHGLEGSSESHYARGLMHALHRRGWRGVVMHHRGCSGEPNRLERSYHSGETGDVAHVVAELRRREPATPLAVVGYSLGGNVLLKWLGETGAQPIAVGVAVSVPFLLARCAARMQRGFSRVYQWELMRRLRASVESKRRRVTLPLQVADVAALRTFREFDDHVTAPLHGFRDADHYYDAASSRRWLRHIHVPTLIIQAADDPFLDSDALPRPEEIPATVEYDLCPHGGHVGFVGGTAPWRPRYWLDERIPAYLAAHLNPAASP